MSLESAQFDLRAFLLTVVSGPDCVSRTFRIVHAQLGDAFHDLEQPSPHPAGGADHQTGRRNLAQPQDDRDQQHGHAEDEGDATEGGIVEKDHHENREQENDRQKAVGDGSPQAVAEVLERHAGHGQVAGGMTVQNAGGKAHETVPEGGFDPGCGTPLEPHHRHVLKQVQQGAQQAERRYAHGDRKEGSRASARRDLIRDESEGEGRQQPDQAVRKTGDHQAREIRGRSAQGDAQQVHRFHIPRRQWPVEHPGFVAQRAGPFQAGRRNPDAASGDRVDLPVCPEHSRQQRNGPAVLGAEGQHRVAVAAPPAAVGFESYAPGPHARRIKNVHEAHRSVGMSRARRNPEIDPLMASDEFQRILKCRVFDTAVPVGRPVIDIEQPMPRGSFGRSAADCPRPFEIDGIDDDQAAVQAFQGESHRVESGERRQQRALLRQRFGGPARQRCLVEQGEPARPRQRDGRLLRLACVRLLRLACVHLVRLVRLVRAVHDTHVQACAGRRLGYPYHAAPYGQGAGGQGLRQTGSGQCGRPRKGDRETRQGLRNGRQPGIGLFREF